MREGKSLSEAVTEAGVFSKVYSTAILAGEKSGNLSGVLEYYIAYQKVSTGVRKKIAATLVYPTLLVVVAVVVLSYLVTAVIPKFALLYRDLNVQLPGPTRLLISLTVDYRYVFLSTLGALVVLALAVYSWSRTEEGGVAFDRLKFRLPIVGDTMLKFQVAQFSRTLSTLLTGGTPLVAGLADRRRHHQQQAGTRHRRPGHPDGARRRVAARRAGHHGRHAAAGSGHD